MRLLLIFLVFLSGCAHKFAMGPNDILISDDVLRITGIYLVDKGSNFYLSSILKNEHDSSITILLGDMTCSRGKVEGRLKGPQVLQLKPNESFDFEPICLLPFEVEVGDFRFGIKRVYESLAAYERTPGKLVAEDIRWVIKSR